MMKQHGRAAKHPETLCEKAEQKNKGTTTAILLRQ